MSLDLIEVLEQLERRAADAEHKLNTGEATTGRTALANIRHTASDAVRHWRADRGETADRYGARA